MRRRRTTERRAPARRAARSGRLLAALALSALIALTALSLSGCAYMLVEQRGVTVVGDAP